MPTVHMIGCGPNAVRKQMSVNDLGRGVMCYDLFRNLQRAVPGLYIAEKHGSAMNERIASLRQSGVGEHYEVRNGQAISDNDPQSKNKPWDNYVAPIYRGLIPEHDLYSPDGRTPLIYGWRHLLMLVSKQCHVRLMDLERATGLHVHA